MSRWTRTLTSVAFLLVLFAPGHLTGQESPVDLADLFDIGLLVLDTNGDSVPDQVGASLVLGPSPTVAQVVAAAEIGARLGFETMAADLPLARGAMAGRTPIVVGRGGLSAAGLSSPGIDPTSLDAGEGVVALHDDGARVWVLVLGGDDPGLHAAARLFAGVLPHTRTLSTAKIGRVRDDLADALSDADLSGTSVRLVQARARTGAQGVTRLVAEARVADGDVDAAAAALRSLERGDRAPPDSAEVGEEGDEAPSIPLSYPGLGSVEVRLPGGVAVRLPGRAEPDAPGPIAGRPGRGAKADLDLSNLFTNDGLLGDSDSNEIPDRVDAMLVPGADAVDGLPDLAARLGLESTGLVVPLVEPASSLRAPGGHPTLVLTGTENRWTNQLADSGRIDIESLEPGEGLIQLVPKAFGSKPSLVVTGADEAGAGRAMNQVALTFPNLAARGKDRPTVNDVEEALWHALSGHSPLGQAATGLYKLDRIAEGLAGQELSSVHVLVSVEKADPGLADIVRRHTVAALDVSDVRVTVDDRDVQNASTILEYDVTLPSEVDRLREIVGQRLLTVARAGEAIEVEARLSEPPDVRARLAEEVRDQLVEAGADADGTKVRILSAFKQGYSWLDESVRPRLEGKPVGGIVIRFRRNEPPKEWPQQAMQTPVRWLHEIFPIDEVLARDLGVELDRIRFEEVTEGPTYEVLASDLAGEEILRDTFDPKWVLRPYFDRFQDYEHVRVTTGWIQAEVNGRALVDERIVTDPEAFWDFYQSEVLPAAYDYVMDRHDGIPRGGNADAPFFGELTVEVEMSEPDYRLGVDNEIHAPMDALHEEVYFGTIEFFDVLGRNSRGQGLTYPGRIIPIMRPRADGAPGRARVTMTGFATSRPAVVVAYQTRSGGSGEVRLDIPKTSLPRPSARLARVRAGEEGIHHLALRVRVDTDADMRDSLLTHGAPLQVDERMVSAAAVQGALAEMERLREAGLYTSELAFPGLGTLEVWAEWSHEQDPDTRRTATLAANGSPAAPADWRALLPDGWAYDGERLVQWDTPIPPSEGHQILAEMATTFPEADVYRVGRSYLGKDVWAMDLTSPISASHWSRAKATTFKPTVVYSARQHANEVSSTSHVLRHAELLLTDPAQRAKLDRVNVVIHPFTNPDGARIAYDLYGITPDYILHAGYLGSLGQDATSGSRDDHPIYPEAPIRNRIWERWLPDIFLNPHGYPSHQVVQLFSEYTGLVRRGRVTERNWGFNKGWFMPGFGYVDSPRFPRHKDAAFEIRDRITRGINSNPDVFAMNQRNYDRYRRYGVTHDPEVFRLPMVDSVLIQMPLKGSTGQGGGYNPRVTIWSGTTEAPDETAYGDWMELVAKAGLSWDQAILDYLADGNHAVKRTGSSFFGGVTLRMNRPRPPEKEDGDDEAAPIS